MKKTRKTINGITKKTHTYLYIFPEQVRKNIGGNPSEIPDFAIVRDCEVASNRKKDKVVSLKNSGTYETYKVQGGKIKQMKKSRGVQKKWKTEENKNLFIVV